MVKSYILGVGIAAVIIVIFVAGALAVTGNLTFKFFSKDPQSVMLDSASKREAADKYTIKYSIAYDVKAGPESVKFSGSLETEKNGDRTRVLNSFQPEGGSAADAAGVTLEMFVLPDGTYVCYRLPSVVCQKAGDTPQQPDISQQADQLVGLVKDGSVKIAYAGSKSFAGRSCDAIDVEYDIGKLTQNVQGNVPNIAGQIQSMKQTWCYDTQTGLPLEQNLDIVLKTPEGQATAVMKTSATSFSLSAGAIELPAEPVELPLTGGFV